MAAEFEIVPATLEHAEALAPTLRAADLAEVGASHGHNGAQALAHSLTGSDAAWAALWDGQVAALFGTAPVSMLGGVGSVWLLGSDLLGTHRKAFWRACRRVLPLLLQRYPVLCNAIDARYAAALRWARRLGAELGEPVPMGVSGELFIPIVFRRSSCASQ